jgi:hypothetical protein
MRQDSWSRYLVAAAVVLIIGAVWVLAGEMEVRVEVRNEGGQEITIDVNGETEVISLDDLEEGETLDYEVGGQTFTVRRVGDLLLLDDDRPGSKGFFVSEAGEGDAKFVWITDDDEVRGERQVVIKKLVDGDEITLDVGAVGEFGGEAEVLMLDGGELGARHVILIKGAEDGIDIEALEEKFGDSFSKSVDEDGTTVLRWVAEDAGAHPIIVEKMLGGHGDFVHYRCEETGSMLTVKKGEGLLDSYVDPVTGCMMEKVDEGPGVHVIKVRKKVEVDDAG